jgi:hypothetical protein
MTFALIRDSEVNKLYVYNNLNQDAVENLEFMFGESNSYGFFQFYKSDKPYDPAVALQFLETGEVNDSTAEVDSGGK